MLLNGKNLTEQQLSTLSSLNLYEISETRTSSILVLAKDAKAADKYARNNPEYFDDYDVDVRYDVHALEVKKLGTYYRAFGLFVCDGVADTNDEVDAIRALDLTGDTLITALNDWEKEQQAKQQAEAKQVPLPF